LAADLSPNIHFSRLTWGAGLLDRKVNPQFAIPAVSQPLAVDWNAEEP
jgi:hypothetical protein